MNVDKHKAPLSPLELEAQHSQTRKEKEAKCPPQREVIRQTSAQPAVQQSHYIWLGDLGFNDDACTLRNGRGLFACEYDYSSIVDYELIEDGLSHGKRGLGKAIAGGLLFGAPGAIVGGITATRKEQAFCTELTILIYLTANVSFIKVPLITKRTKKSSNAYRTAKNTAQAIIAQLHRCPHELARKNQARQALQECLSSRAAKSQGASSVLTTTNAPSPASAEEHFSVADELLKLKSLLDAGLLTKEEFEAQKQKLLNTQY